MTESEQEYEKIEISATPLDLSRYTYIKKK